MIFLIILSRKYNYRILRQALSLSRSFKAAERTTPRAEPEGRDANSSAALDWISGAIFVGSGQSETMLAQPVKHIKLVSTTTVDFFISPFPFFVNILNVFFMIVTLDFLSH